MTHDAIRERLHDYLDGALPPGERGQVAAHVEVCVACREELDRLERLLEQARALPRSIAPPHDLWPSVAARVGVGRRLGERSLWSLRWPLAAAAAALVVVSAVATVLVVGRPEDSLAGRAPDAVALPAYLVRWHETEATYRRAVAQLEEALAAGRDRLSPQAMAVLERNLRIIDAAIAESRAALAADPANREVMDMLSSIYEKKLDVLQQVARLSARL